MTRWEHNKTSMQEQVKSVESDGMRAILTQKGARAKTTWDPTGHRMQIETCPSRLLKDRDQLYLTVYPEGCGQGT